MANYTKTVNFATKDALTTGDANKIVKGTEIDAEFNNIATAIATKVDAGSGGLVSLTTGVQGVLPVANGGTGSSSGTPATTVLAGTFGTGTFSFNASSLLRVGAASPSVNWRLYSMTTGDHPAVVADMAGNVDATGLLIISTAAPTPVNYISFTTSQLGAEYAAISGNGTTVTYGSGSDYRLKTNVLPLADSATKVKALKPCSYSWVNAPELQSQGFLAHELAEVVPQAVVGAKDAVNADGSIKSQQVDLSYVVPLLTAALQEALARIEALEAA